MSTLAPLVLIPGAGTELCRGLGVVLDGIAVSTVVAMAFLSCLGVGLCGRARTAAIPASARS